MSATFIPWTMWARGTPGWRLCSSTCRARIGRAGIRGWSRSLNWKAGSQGRLHAGFDCPGRDASTAVEHRFLRCSILAQHDKFKLGNIMFDSARLFLFLTAALLLAVAPGPGMLYVLARSLAGGKREGVLSAFGTFLGGMVHVFAAALGISIILARSAAAFAVVKYVGAAYLCFLGVRMILDGRRNRGSTELPTESLKPGRNPL